MYGWLGLVLRDSLLVDRVALFLCPIYLSAFPLSLSLFLPALEAAAAPASAAEGMYEALLSCLGDE